MNAIQTTITIIFIFSVILGFPFACIAFAKICKAIEDELRIK